MCDKAPDDTEIIEEKLERVLEEAWSKVNKAVDKVTNSSGDSIKTVWYAAEALEFASFLFNLAHGLEDFDPEFRSKKKESPQVLVKDSLEHLRMARELRHKSVTQAYTSLRMAADELKTAYLSKVKDAAKKPR